MSWFRINIDEYVGTYYVNTKSTIKRGVIRTRVFPENELSVCFVSKPYKTAEEALRGHRRIAKDVAAHPQRYISELQKYRRDIAALTGEREIN